MIEEIDLTALQLAFMSMDGCDLVSASKWLERSKDAIKGVRIHERTRAHIHATGRLYFQQQRFEDSFQSYERLGEDPLVDILAKRRAVVCATVAAAAAETNRPDLAGRLVKHCVEIIGREPPSVPLDYATELSIRALRSLDRAPEAERLAIAYARRRKLRFDRPLAPFYCGISLALHGA